MKTLLLVCALGLVLISPVFAAPANNLYTHAISTITITQTDSLPDIAYSPCNIKYVDVTNVLGNAQTISVYSNVISSNTTRATLVYTFEVPASTGTFSMPIFEGGSDTWSSVANLVNVPYVAFKSNAAYGQTATINVKYWK